jgi:spore germination protein KC
LKGFITAEDSKYFLFTTNRIKGGVLNVKASTGNTVAALEIFGNKTSIMPVVEDGKLKFTVHTETDVALDELDETLDVTGKDQLNSFEAAAEMQLQDSIVRVIKLVQEQYGVDIFGFCDILHRNDPQTWYQLRQNWDDVFRNLEVDVTCKIHIRNTSSVAQPVKVGG